MFSSKFYKIFNDMSFNRTLLFIEHNWLLPFPIFIILFFLDIVNSNKAGLFEGSFFLGKGGGSN